MRFTPEQRAVLKKLAELDGDALDPVAEGLSPNVVTGLAKRLLAKRVGAGLYRVSLRGLVEYRRNRRTL